MKNLIFYFIFLLAIGSINAQEQNNFMLGDVLILGQPTGNSYVHIHFPKKNIIIKRGAITNFKNLAGQKLVVHEITTSEDGNLVAVLKKKNGKKFFRFFSKVQADLTKALDSGELKLKENTLIGK